MNNSTSVYGLPGLSVAGLALIMTSLALSIYWSIAHPAQSIGAIFGFFVLMLCGVWMSLIPMVEAQDKRWKGTTMGAAAALAMALPTILLLTSQLSLLDGRKNLGGKTPELAMEISETLSANPLNLWRVFVLTSDITPASLNSDDWKLFNQAAQAGVKSQEIDRVLANGIVLRGDKEALIGTLLTAAQSNRGPDMELASLLTAAMD